MTQIEEYAKKQQYLRNCIIDCSCDSCVESDDALHMTIFISYWIKQITSLIVLWWPWHKFWLEEMGGGLSLWVMSLFFSLQFIMRVTMRVGVGGRWWFWLIVQLSLSELFCKLFYDHHNHSLNIFILSNYLFW